MHNLSYKLASDIGFIRIYSYHIRQHANNIQLFMHPHFALPFTVEHNHSRINCKVPNILIQHFKTFNRMQQQHYPISRWHLIQLTQTSIDHLQIVTNPILFSTICLYSADFRTISTHQILFMYLP